jgi:anti-sigma B factor antagonist
VLSVTNQRVADVASIAVSGEIDVLYVEKLAGELAAAANGDAERVEVDLSGVTFIDSTGINALVKGRRLALASGKHYRVTGSDGFVRDVLQMAGVWNHLTGLTP